MGGRNEAQFNIGLSHTRLRIGLGFESTKKMHGKPDVVQAVYESFVDSLQRYRRGFDKFVEENSLQVEWCPRGGQKREYVPTGEAIGWLLSPPSPFPDWILVGRLLYRGRDAEILEDPTRLGDVMETVFKGFLHPWEQAQTESYRR